MSYWNASFPSPCRSVCNDQVPIHHSITSELSVPGDKISSGIIKPRWEFQFYVSQSPQRTVPLRTTRSPGCYRDNWSLPVQPSVEKHQGWMSSLTHAHLGFKGYCRSEQFVSSSLWWGSSQGPTVIFTQHTHRSSLCLTCSLYVWRGSGSRLYIRSLLFTCVTVYMLLTNHSVDHNWFVLTLCVQTQTKRQVFITYLIILRSS